MNLTFVGTILVLQRQKKDLSTVKKTDILLIDPLDSVMFKVYKLLGIAVGQFTGDLHFTTIFSFDNQLKSTAQEIVRTISGPQVESIDGTT